MKAVLIASALTLAAIAPAAAESCVMNGAFVPCPSQMGMMNGGMMNGGRMGMQGGPGMMDDRGLSHRRMTRAERRRMRRMEAMQNQQ